MEEKIQNNLKQFFDEKFIPNISMINLPDHHQSINQQQRLEEHKHIQNILQIKKWRPKAFTNKPSKTKKEKKIVEQNTNLKKGHWSVEENKKYHWFLEIYNDHFVNKHLRRMDKIFKTMAIFIGTRQAQQCRSHHQKMEKKHHSFYKIIGSLRKCYFGSLNSEPLITELKENNIDIIKQIIDAQEIQNQQKSKEYENNYVSQIKQQQSLDENLKVEEFLSSQKNNLFGDQYQHNLPFDFQ